MDQSYRKSNLCSRLFNFWQCKLIYKSFRNKKVEKQDLFRMKVQDDSQVLLNQLEYQWQKEKKTAKAKGKKPVFMTAFHKAFCCRFISFTSIGIANQCMIPCYLYLIKLLVQYIQDPEQDVQYGVGVMLGFIALAFGAFILRHIFFFYSTTFSLVIRKSTGTILYKKILKITQKSLSQATPGKLINLSSGDMAPLERGVAFYPYIIVSPIVCIIAVIYVYLLVWFMSIIQIKFIQVGPIVFYALLVIIALYLVQFLINSRIVKVRLMMSRATDRRLKLINQLINGIRTIKAYAWDSILKKVIEKSRIYEIKKYVSFALIQSSSVGFFRNTGVLLILPVLLIQVASGNRLTPGTTFATIGLLNFMSNTTIFFLSLAMNAAAQYVAFMKRLGQVLSLEELDDQDGNSEQISQIKADLKLAQGERIKAINLCTTWGFDKSHLNLVRRQTTIKAQKNQKNRQKKKMNSSKVGVFDRSDEFPLDGTKNQDNQKQILVNQNINFQLQSQQLLAVIGQVGSGKSSLLASIMHQNTLISGNIAVQGSIAYVEQEPFILSDTVRNNITFGQEEVDQNRLAEAIKVCQLEDDLKLFPKGVDTQIGQRGVNISGGQKARLSLARAIYSDADIYLLDDPLSAVDPNVAEKIFNDCIVGYLKHKARVLVTHQIHFIPAADRILILDAGKQNFIGTYQQLLQGDIIDIAKILESYQQTGDGLGNKRKATLKQLKKNKQLTEGILRLDSASTLIHKSLLDDKETGEPQDQQEEKKDSDKQAFEVSKADEKKQKEKKDNLIIVEQKSKGFIRCKDFKFYYEYSKGRFLNVFLLLFSMTPWILRGFLQLFIVGWINQSLNDQQRTRNYLIFSLSILGIMVLGTVSSFAMYLLGLTISKNLHNKMLQKVSRAPIQFFDSNPSGRIINRFSKDTSTTDSNLPLQFLIFYDTLWRCVLAVSLSVTVFPLLLLVLVLLLGFMVIIRRHALILSTQSMRWDAITRSPINSLFSSTLNGLMTIRSYNKSLSFMNKFFKLSDENGKAFFTFHSAQRWMGFFLDNLTFIYVAVYAIFSVSFKGWIDLDPALVGLGITMALELSGRFQFLVRISSQIENSMASVQRIQDYIKLASEPQIRQPNDIELQRENWPRDGEISVQNLTMRYRENFDPVLKNLTFRIDSMMKIGVVGRTGAGKSSIIQSLFRLVQADEGSKILIDDVDTKTIGLHTLREKISIIPQSPFLFYGTIRQNLDPFRNYTDGEIWACLDDVQLGDYVRSPNCQDQLLTQVSEGSSAFSVGQKQLICLARAILKRNRILVLDEATANVDMATDKLIQETIRRKFKECTVITIAHRLATIMDSDKILVLNEGQIVQYDHPFLLLVKQKSDNQITSIDGHFAKMVKATGKQSQVSLFNVAKQSYLNSLME